MPDGEALRAAVALSSALAKVEDETSMGFNKRDADVEVIRKDVSSIEVAMATTGEMNLIEWMLGTTLAAVVTILFRVFSH